MSDESLIDPTPINETMPQFCVGCGLLIDEPHGCECEWVEVRVLIRLKE